MQKARWLFRLAGFGGSSAAYQNDAYFRHKMSKSQEGIAQIRNRILGEPKQKKETQMDLPLITTALGLGGALLGFALKYPKIYLHVWKLLFALVGVSFIGAIVFYSGAQQAWGRARAVYYSIPLGTEGRDLALKVADAADLGMDWMSMALVLGFAAGSVILLAGYLASLVIKQSESEEGQKQSIQDD